MMGVHGLSVDLHQGQAVLDFADYYVDADVDAMFKRRVAYSVANEWGSPTKWGAGLDLGTDLE